MLVAELTEQGRPLARNLLSFAKTKDLMLPPPELRVDVAPASGGERRRARGQGDGARASRATVYLTSGGGGGRRQIPGRFDDNFFDLLPGETRTVLFRPARATTAEALRAALRATTIADSY